MPGAGGITRGRGDAELTWGEESDEQGIKFREVAIPQGVPDEEGELLRTRITKPNADPVAPNGRSAARSVGDTAGGQGWKQPLRPRHREVVKKYFGSDDE